MKSNELRIGNYILHEPTIDDWEEIIITLPSLLQIDISPESYCGIPLTEEWLLKFGFEYNNYTGSWIKNEFAFDLDKTVNGGVNSFDVYVKDEEFVLTAIQSVHQLQNLYFALTGEELILN